MDKKIFISFEGSGKQYVPQKPVEKPWLFHHPEFVEQECYKDPTLYRINLEKL